MIGQGVITEYACLARSYGHIGTCQVFLGELPRAELQPIVQHDIATVKLGALMLAPKALDNPGMFRRICQGAFCIFGRLRAARGSAAPRYRPAWPETYRDPGWSAASPGAGGG